MTPIQALEHIRMLCARHIPIDRKEIGGIAMQAIVRATPIQPVASAPPLTLAQQHADELVTLVRSASSVLKNHQNIQVSEFQLFRANFVDRSTSILDAIDPPPPPTLEEALDLIKLLGNMQDEDGRTAHIKEFLDRVPK